MGASEKHDAAFHPGTGPTPRGAADVLREHEYTWHDGPGAGYRCPCGKWVEGSLWDHLADMLAAAGLLVTAEPHPVVDPMLRPGQAVEFDRWLAEHDAQVAAQALRDAADARDAALLWGDPGPSTWLRARADRIAGGAE